MSKLTEEVRARLTYIVESPSAENGGFHPETVEAAKQALALVQQVEAAEKLAEALHDQFLQLDTGRYCCCGAEGDDAHAGICDDGNAALAHWEEVTKL